MPIIIDTWKAQVRESCTEIVIPDGCSDVILKVAERGSPIWFVSSLQDRCRSTVIESNTQLFGFRLQSGTRIDQAALLAKLEPANDLDAIRIIPNYCSQHRHIDEALQTLQCREMTVSDAAQCLVINQRGLQRLIQQETGKTPLFWIRLAKVRRTARAIINGMPLGDSAFENGYADQAHMSREIKHWLGITPSKLPEQSSIRQQLSAKAYC